MDQLQNKNASIHPFAYHANKKVQHITILILFWLVSQKHNFEQQVKKI